MAGGDLEDGLEREKTRFTSLLHPNRDLAANWTVDVEKQLEAYLTELASTGIFEDDQCALNFAEAALLIQGSIQVYSRKVEYLYSLVLQALNFLGQKRQGDEGTSSVQLDDSSMGNGEANDEEFLNLDDVHEEANIDILDEEVVSSVHAAVKIPACLLAAEAEPTDMFGEAGELATYETATSIMHRTFLLLDPCDTDTVDRYLDGDAFRAEKGAIPPTPGSAMPTRTPRTHRETPSERTGSAQKRANPETQFGNASDGGCAFHCEPDWQEGDQGGTHWDDPNVGERDEDEGLRDEDTRDGAANVEAQCDGYIDPWAPLNPHEPGTLMIKPYKKGLTQRKKPRLKKRRSNSSTVATRTGVSCPEFQKALQVRERVEKAERRRHGPDGIPSFETLRSFFRDSYEGVPADVARQNLGFEERAEGFGGESDVEGNDDWPERTFDPQEDIQNDILDTSYAHDIPDPPQPASKGKESQSENYSSYMDMPSFGEERGEEMSFEELCRAHLDSMLRKLSEAHSRTGLTSRVTKWKNKIEATLVEEDTRPPFDIHEYSDRLLDELSTLAARSQDEDEEIQESFTYLVRGQERDQVARSFSALLQLVNNGNVIIEKGEVSGESVCFTGEKPFTVKLLSSQNKHEGMFENMISAKTSNKAPGRGKGTRPPPSTDRSRGQQRIRVVHERSNLVCNPQSPGSPSGSRSSLAATMSPGSTRRSSRKRGQTLNSKRGGSPEKENRGALTPLHTTPVKLTPDGRHRSRRKALTKLVQ